MSRRNFIEAWSTSPEFGARYCEHRETIASWAVMPAYHLKKLILRDGTELEIKVRSIDWKSNFVPILQHQDLIKVAVLSGQEVYDQRLYPEGSENVLDPVQLPVSSGPASGAEPASAADHGQEGSAGEGTVRVEVPGEAGEPVDAAASVQDQGSAALTFWYETLGAAQGSYWPRVLTDEEKAALAAGADPTTIPGHQWSDELARLPKPSVLPDAPDMTPLEQLRLAEHMTLFAWTTFRKLPVLVAEKTILDQLWQATCKAGALLHEAEQEAKARLKGDEK